MKGGVVVENEKNYTDRPVNTRRRKRSKEQIFREDYLPLAIAGLAVVMILIFIIGSITRGIQKAIVNKNERLEASIAESVAKEEMDSQVDALINEAEILAMGCDYEGAINKLKTFTGDTSDYPVIADQLKKYNASLSELVVWDDPSKVLNLSFQLLIADPSRAFANATYGASFNKNFITTDEFSKIIQQLYDNNYILVSLDDITDGVNTFSLKLPKDKKPLILTQTQVNYYTYMIDSDNDFLPDAGGSGFASKMVLDANGNLACEMVDASGQVVTGAYDMVPILEAFIETHPDFSYKGARAILAVTGYDGLFGYRTSNKAMKRLSDEEYTNEVNGATAITEALRNAGYEIACYTYENIPYGGCEIDKLKYDLEQWRMEVSPILGVVDTLVFAQNSDIAPSSSVYSGEKFDAISQQGFTRYLGFANGAPWYDIQANYFRMGRTLVTGSNLINHADWFEGILDAVAILDANRGSLES